MLGRTLLAAMGPAFGWLSDHASDRVAFAALAAVFLALSSGAWALHRRARRIPALAVPP
jgi:myo-inositol catabolism protein IolC